MDRELYRRRQRRRAIIAWSVAGLVVALFAVAVIFGEESEHSRPAPAVDVFSSEMTSEQYEAIHKGEGESRVLQGLQNVGLQEDQVEGSQLPALFPPPPAHSVCSYWTLSDAPEHVVRLCFSDPQGVLLQKAVVAPGEEAAPATLA